MASTISNIAEILQRKYSKGVWDQLNTKTPVRNLVNKISAKDKFNGLFIQDAVKFGRNSTGGWTGEDQPIPSAGSSTVQNTVIHPTFAWFKGSVGHAMRLRSQGPEAFINAMTLEVMGLKDYAMTQLERTICSKDCLLTTKLAKSSTGATSTMGTSIAAAATTFYMPDYDAVRLDVGGRVEFWEFTGLTNRDSTTVGTKLANPGSHDYYTISAVDFGQGSIGGLSYAKITIEEPLAAAITTTAATASAMVKDEALVASGTQIFTNEPTGIRACVDTGGQQFQTYAKSSAQATDTFQGITVATYPQWKSQTIAAATGDLTPQVLEEAFTRIKIFSGRSTNGIKYIMVHPVQQEVWRKNRYPEQRVYLSQGGTEGGSRGIPSATNEKTYPTYNGIPLVDSRYFNHDEAILFDPTSARMYVLAPFQMWREGDQGYHKAYNNTPEIEFEFFIYENFGCQVRNCNAVITGLSTS